MVRVCMTSNGTFRRSRHTYSAECAAELVWYLGLVIPGREREGILRAWSQTNGSGWYYRYSKDFTVGHTEARCRQSVDKMICKRTQQI